jgi:hypothetical protein
MVSLGTAVPAGQGCVNAARGDATRRQRGPGTSVGTASGRRYTVAFSPRCYELNLVFELGPRCARLATPLSRSCNHHWEPAVTHDAATPVRELWESIEARAWEAAAGGLLTTLCATGHRPASAFMAATTSWP